MHFVEMTSYKESRDTIFACVIVYILSVLSTSLFSDSFSRIWISDGLLSG